MKPLILFNAPKNTWAVAGIEGEFTASQLAERFGITNPVIYCQQWREERHAKPGRDVK